MELVIISLLGALIVVAMIILVVVQTRQRSLYWNERSAMADRMQAKDREWLEAHGVHVK